MRGKRNIGITIAAWLCLVVQAVIAFPHHHHGAEEAPCFNAAHCAGILFAHHAGDAGGEDGCECAHNHCVPETEQPAADHGCSLRVDVPVVADNKPVITVPPVQTASFYDLFAPCSVSGTGNRDTVVSFTLTAGRLSPPGPKICVVYLTEAHSVRAPSLS